MGGQRFHHPDCSHPMRTTTSPMPSRRIQLLELRLRIEAGLYDIDSDQIAGALLRRGGLTPLTPGDARSRPPGAVPQRRAC